MEESSPILSSMDTAYGSGSLPSPKIALQGTPYPQIRYLNHLVIIYNIHNQGQLVASHFVFP